MHLRNSPVLVGLNVKSCGIPRSTARISTKSQTEVIGSTRSPRFSRKGLTLLTWSGERFWRTRSASSTRKGQLGRYESDRLHTQCDSGWFSFASELFRHLASVVVWTLRRVSCHSALCRQHRCGDFFSCRPAELRLAAPNTAQAFATGGLSRRLVFGLPCHVVVFRAVALANTPRIFCRRRLCWSSWSLDLCQIGFQENRLTIACGLTSLRTFSRSHPSLIRAILPSVVDPFVAAALRSLRSPRLT